MELLKVHGQSMSPETLGRWVALLDGAWAPTHSDKALRTDIIAGS